MERQSLGYDNINLYGVSCCCLGVSYGLAYSLWPAAMLCLLEAERESAHGRDSVEVAKQKA
jgi:hypothetical protein